MSKTTNVVHMRCWLIIGARSSLMSQNIVKQENKEKKKS